MRKLFLSLGLLLGLCGAAEAQCNGMFPPANICASIAGGPPGQVPWGAFISGVVNVPKTTLLVLQPAPFNFTPDAAATLIKFTVRGAGGGGTGNIGNNTIPFGNYGQMGGPSAVGSNNQTVTITLGTPGVITTPTHTAAWECNRPVYFINNGDTLPTQLAFNTVYYVYCGSAGEGGGTGAATPTTLQLSLTPFNSPLTCSVYAPFCQTPLTLSGPNSGTHILNVFLCIATQGGGGGGFGDGGIPGVGIGCSSNNPVSGYPQGFNYTGGIGGNVNGSNVAPGTGGGGACAGDGGRNAGQGTNLQGGGGSGAFPTIVASGGGGGGGGGCGVLYMHNPGTTIPLICGGPGQGGMNQVQSAVFTANNPVFSAVGANMDIWAPVTIGASILSGGIAAPGSGYVNGTYTNVPLIYEFGVGQGSGALATITVSGNAVTAVTITTAGVDYFVNDLLTAATANIGGGGGGGFTWTVLTTNTPTGITAGTSYNVSPSDNTGNNYNLYNQAYGSIITPTTGGFGTITINSGTAGAAGGAGDCEITQFYGIN